MTPKERNRATRLLIKLSQKAQIASDLAKKALTLCGNCRKNNFAQTTSYCSNCNRGILYSDFLFCNDCAKRMKRCQVCGELLEKQLVKGEPNNEF